MSELPNLFIDEDGDACFLPSGAERNLVALPARDESGELLNPEIWHGMIAAWNSRADLSPALGAVAMREAAAGVCADLAIQSADAALTGLHEQARIRESMEAAATKCAILIRAISIPSDADLDRAALARPKVAALVEACDDNIGKWLSAALDDDGVCAEMKADICVWFAAIAALEASHE